MLFLLVMIELSKGSFIKVLTHTRLYRFLNIHIYNGVKSAFLARLVPFDYHQIGSVGMLFGLTL